MLHWFNCIFRWLARAMSVVAVLLFAAFLFGGDESSSAFSLVEFLGFCLFPVGVSIGFLIAWKIEIPGAIVSLSSLDGFYLWHYLRAGHFDLGIYFALFTSPALFFLVAGITSIFIPKHSGHETL